MVFTTKNENNTTSIKKYHNKYKKLIKLQNGVRWSPKKKIFLALKKIFFTIERKKCLKSGKKNFFYTNKSYWHLSRNLINSNT